MRSVVISLLLTIRVSLRDRAALQLEILALRHQLHVLREVGRAAESRRCIVAMLKTTVMTPTNDSPTL